MMGIKERVFGPLPPVTLEDLVSADHVYRHLERTLDLSFVRDLVCDASAETGRPSIDPVVFFKLQLTLFFEGLRSERQLMQVVADRLSMRWYLGGSGETPSGSGKSIRANYLGGSGDYVFIDPPWGTNPPKMHVALEEDAAGQLRIVLTAQADPGEVDLDYPVEPVAAAATPIPE